MGQVQTIIQTCCSGQSIDKS